MDYLEWARYTFKDDIFATEAAGIVIDEAREDYSRCSMEIKPKHLNARNTVMGGAIFTLADLAFAVAANSGKPLTVTLNSQISFLGVAKGKKLIAEAKAVKSGKMTCVFTVDITDELGTKVAFADITGMRMVK